MISTSRPGPTRAAERLAHGRQLHVAADERELLQRLAAACASRAAPDRPRLDGLRLALDRQGRLGVVANSVSERSSTSAVA